MFVDSILHYTETVDPEVSMPKHITQLYAISYRDGETVSVICESSWFKEFRLISFQ
jgi:hypothetical protein